jgi:hypothetical protein
MRVGRSEKDIRADAVIISMSPPSYPSAWLHPGRARAVSPGKIIVPRMVIGGAILDQPAGGISAAKRGASSLQSRAARSGVVGPPASLAARRIRWRRAAGPCSESHTSPQAWSTDSRFLGPSTHRPGFGSRSRAFHIPSTAAPLRLWHTKALNQEWAFPQLLAGAVVMISHCANPRCTLYLFTT